MKTVILAGGFGTRLSEKTDMLPKPMVEVGGKPILWHIMQIYAAYGQTEFIVALGYKPEVIKEYFLNFYALNNDFSIDLATGETTIYDGQQPNWKVHLVDTGLQTQTGGRVKRLKEWIGNEPFMLTYGDGVANVPIDQLLDFHKRQGKIATVTGVRPPSRFGGLCCEGTNIVQFSEKPLGGEGWISGGFFVFEPDVFDYIDGDDTALERQPLERLAQDGQLVSYFHDAFWQPMDTLRDHTHLETLWQSKKAPWKVWI